MPKPNKKIGAGTALLTLIPFFRSLNDPHKLEVVLYASGIWVSLVLFLWDWDWTKGSSLKVGKWFRPFLLIVLTGLVSSLLGWYRWPQTIVVSPSEFTFGNFAYGKETHSFTVENKSPHDLYYVQLSVTAVGYDSNPDDYEYRIATLKPVFPDSDFADTISLECTPEAPHTRILVFQILHLLPNERREFFLTHRTNSLSTIRAAITRFTDEQPAVVGDVHTMEQHLMYPEHVVCVTRFWPPEGKSNSKDMTSTVTQDTEQK